MQITYTPLQLKGLDQLSVDISKKIYHEYVEALITHMESGDMTQQEINEASGFILDSLNLVSSEKDVVLMLKEIEKRWPKLDTSNAKVQGYLTQSADKDKLKVIQDQLIRLTA